jgi:hypothetical protein
MTLALTATAADAGEVVGDPGFDDRVAERIAAVARNILLPSRPGKPPEMIIVGHLAGCVEHKPDRRSKGVCDEINVRTQVERTLTQFQGEAIPDNHPVIPQLNGLFGEHTFFLDGHGPNIVEPAEAAGSDAQLAKVVNVANWSD